VLLNRSAAVTGKSGNARDFAVPHEIDGISIGGSSVMNGTGQSRSKFIEFPRDGEPDGCSGACCRGRRDAQISFCDNFPGVATAQQAPE
jgi:hypothetical protein